MYSHRDNCYDDYFYFIKNIYNLYIDYLISDFYVGDNRGGFTKSFEKDIFAETGIVFDLNETFVSNWLKKLKKNSLIKA